MGIPDHLTCLLKNLYAGQEARVIIGHGTTGWFKIEKEICQGCILSLCLFNLCAEFSSVQPLNCDWHFVTPWTAAHQASLSITNSWSLLKLVSITLVMRPSYPLSSPFPPAFNLAQHQGPFQILNQMAKILEFHPQSQFFQWLFRTDVL